MVRSFCRPVSINKSELAVTEMDVIRILADGTPDIGFGARPDSLVYADGQDIDVTPLGPTFDLSGLPVFVEQMDWEHTINFTDPGDDEWAAG